VPVEVLQTAVAAMASPLQDGKATLWPQSCPPAEWALPEALLCAAPLHLCTGAETGTGQAENRSGIHGGDPTTTVANRSAYEWPSSLAERNLPKGVER